MGKGFKDQRTILLQYDILFAYCLQAVTDCGFAILSFSPDLGEIVVKASINRYSFGELIHLTIKRDGEVSIHSKCVLPTQLIDCGKNKANIEKIFLAIDTLTIRENNEALGQSTIQSIPSSSVREETIGVNEASVAELSSYNDEERLGMINLIRTHNRRLQKLREQLAFHGSSTDPGIVMEIEDIEVKVKDLQERLRPLNEGN